MCLIFEEEHILDHLIIDKDLFKMPSGPYGVLTARDSITDHYAVEAENSKINSSQFAHQLKRNSRFFQR